MSEKWTELESYKRIFNLLKYEIWFNKKYKSFPILTGTEKQMEDDLNFLKSKIKELGGTIDDK